MSRLISRASELLWQRPPAESWLLQIVVEKAAGQDGAWR
jgi:hypothetical protein